jgi:murein DD-endopeptidase MepM/ murein hydrolase activator NlpD
MIRAPKPRSPLASPARAVVACALALAWQGAPAVATGVVPLEVELRARALGPGEPVRVVVTAAQPLDSLEGEFLGEPVFFVRETGSGGDERWTGWAMIGLEEEAGLGVLELRGRTPAGRPAAATRAVTIEPHAFPEETLTVAPKYVEPPAEVRARIARERKKLKAIYATRRAVAPAARPFVRPVPGEPTSPFGTRRIFNGVPRSPHSGLDLRAATGTVVLSAGRGRVVLAQELYYSGKAVIVDHGGGLFTVYAHLSVLSVAEGDGVEAGQAIGRSGATGRVTGPHLHWGAKVGDRPFDPRALLDARLFERGDPDQ